jgi:hypothetical protein
LGHGPTEQGIYRTEFCDSQGFGHLMKLVRSIKPDSGFH